MALFLKKKQSKYCENIECTFTNAFITRKKKYNRAIIFLTVTDLFMNSDFKDYWIAH